MRRTQNPLTAHRFWVWAFCAAVPLSGQPFSPSGFKTILYGASYYHEYMPVDRLEEDARMMEQAGITLVRLGESTWSSWEPREGDFQFAWMERIVDRLHRAGIRVILGTPTYSIPPWLYRKHPEILVVPLGGIRGAQQHYGPRQNMDISHPTYRFYCERIIRRVVSHFKDHPAVIGYQIDNETGPYGTAGRNVQVGFVRHLQNVFGSVDAVNKAWGLAYWGQLLSGWEDVPPRDGILNPGWKLEWERYQHGLVTDFIAWQAGIVNEYKRPDQFVTQNFVGGLRTNIDEFEIARHLDVTAVNPYHAVQDNLTGWEIALSGDLCRSLKRTNYLITETNAQTTGWDSKSQFPPYDGQLRLNVYAHLASGANAVAYWHWHSLHYGQETYWKGVLSHDLEPNRAYREVARTAGELKKIGARLANLRKPNAVAVLYSVDSHHGIECMPFDHRVNYTTLAAQLHRTLYRLNVEADFVFPQSEHLADYQVICVPPLYIADDALLEKLNAFVRNGGHLLVCFKSGFCNEFSTVRRTRQPGPLREAAGFSYQEFSTLSQPLALKDDPFQAGEENRVSVWAEFLVPETASPLAWYDHPFFGKYPAVTRNRYGKGTLTYEGTVLSDKLQEKVVLDVLRNASIDLAGTDLPSGIRTRKGVNARGRWVRYYFNYSSENRSFIYPHAGGIDLLTGKAIKPSRPVSLLPWDLLVVEEM